MRVIRASLFTFATLMATLPVPLHAWSTHQTVIGLPAPADKRTSLPVSNSTKSFWFTDADVRPVPHEGSEGPVTDGADICIIGSGITGVSAAYHLSRAFSGDNSLAASLGRPVKAVLFEAREFCSGATGRNGGHLTAHKFGEFRRWQKELGQEEAMRALEIEQYTVKELTRILKENGKEEYVDLTHGGRLMLMFSEQELTETKADYEAAKSAGADMTGVEWLSKEEVWRRYGAPYPAVLIPGNNLWPLKAVSVLYNLAQNSSANFSLNLHTRTPVTSISPIEASNAVANSPFPRRHTLTTPRGPVTCSYVLHATNAYASHLLPHLAGPNGIVPTRGQIIAVRASVPAKELSDVGGTGNEGFEYWFPRPVKSDAEETPLVIVGGGREVAKGFELYETDDSVINKDVGVALRAFLPATFPEKYDAEQDPEMEWTGIMGYTHSGDPFVGPVVDKGQRGDNPAYDGQFIAAGYAGHGMPRAFACAEAVVGMIVADIQGKMWSPPSWLPRGYLTQHKDASQTG